MVRPKLRLREIVACARGIGDAFRDPLLILGGDLRVLCANRAFYQRFGGTAAETANLPLARLNGGRWHIPELFALLSGTGIKGAGFDNLPVGRDFAGIGYRHLLLTGRELSRPHCAPLRLLFIEDVTARRATETTRVATAAGLAETAAGLVVTAAGLAETAVGLAEAQGQDKRIALALQRPMLFQPKEDAFSGLSVQTAYTMASEEALVGGDFWDTFAFNQRHVALVIGDVMGHGLTSSIFTTELKYTMRAYIREHVQPARIMNCMNEYLCQSNRLFREGINAEGSDVPACISLAVIERDTGAGMLAIGGMEPPILVRAHGGTEQTAAVGIPLGVFEDEQYAQVAFQLEAGDTLIMPTDGIAEARRGLEFLDIEGLTRLAVDASSGTLKEMADAILDGARRFAGGKLKDDASLVLVRRTADSPVIAGDGTP